MTDTVLLIDDEMSNLIVFEAAFEGRFTVLTASDADTAIDLLRAHEVAVVLADQRMPGTSGVDFLERVRREFPIATRILITAYADLSEAIDAINRGRIQGYLRKPWNDAEVEARVREAVESYNARRELAVLKRRLVESERLYTLGVLSAGLVHELRSPLMVLGGSLDLIEQAIRALPEEVRMTDAARGGRSLRGALEQLGDARDAVRRIADIASEVGRKSAERGSRRSAQLREVLDLSLRHADPSLLRRANVVVEVEDAPPVTGSTTQLSQIVLNLLTNALQAFPEAGDPATQTVTLRVRHEGDSVQLSIEDNGPGMDAERREEVFRPFFTTKGDEGTGLGLAIVRKIAHDLGGEVRVESDPGRGSRFSVRLVPAPASDAD